jgi:hypothetical protein
MGARMEASHEEVEGRAAQRLTGAVDSSLRAPTTQPAREAAVLAFLTGEFHEEFAQLRHHDGQILEICKFAFTGYVAVVGGALALYRYGAETANDYSLPAAAVLGVAAVIGCLLLALMVRDRVYSVMVRRHINEIRGFFLTYQDVGFANVAKLPTQPSEQPFFRKVSSQLWQMYTMSVLNASLVAIATWLTAGHEWWVAAGIAALAAHLLGVFTHLRSRERKPRLD